MIDARALDRPDLSCEQVVSSLRIEIHIYLSLQFPFRDEGIALLCRGNLGPGNNSFLAPYGHGYYALFGRWETKWVDPHA